MKKLALILVLAIIGFTYSCEKEDVATQNEFKKKPTGNNGNGNGNNNTTIGLMAITGGDTIIITPLSPIYVAVGDTVLLTVNPSQQCSWANSNMAAAQFYVLNWNATPFNFYGDQCWLIGLDSVAPDNWGLITAGYTYPNGTRVNTTNYYYVLP